MRQEAGLRQRDGQCHNRHRARAARDFLLNLGVEAHRVEAISYGLEEAQGRSEGSPNIVPSWAHDCRADSFTLAGAETVTRLLKAVFAVNISPLIGGGFMLVKRFLKSMMAVTIAVLCCALLNSPLAAQEPADLTKLAAQLNHGDATVRLAAVEALIKRDDAASGDLLISALDDPVQEIRRDVALALGERGYVRAAEPLIRLLRSADARDRRIAIIALGGVGGDKGREALIATLRSSSTEERESAVSALGHTKDEKAVEALSQALKDESYQVRVSAAFSLGGIGGNRAVELLLAALNDTTDSVRAAAAIALGETGDLRAIEPLEKLLKQDKSESTRQHIETSLRQLTASAVRKP